MLRTVVCTMRKQRASRASQYGSPTYKEIKKRLMAALLRLRERRDWSQEEAAHRCGMTTRLYQHAEAGTGNLTFTTLARLSEGFEVDVRDLLPLPPRRSKTSER